MPATNAPRTAPYYLFDKKSHQLQAGPAETKQDLFLDSNEKQPPGTEILTVPQGTIVVQAAPPTTPTLTPTSARRPRSSCSPTARR